ncbi:hypothetical protein [Chryseobacterium sp. 3008163]|nr:hypothetical protein [Chryseobacterium sp. 3008163]
MNLNPKFPLFLPGVKNSSNDNVSIIGVNLREDVTTIAYYVSSNGGIETKTQKNYPTKEYTAFSEILTQFIQEEQLENVKRLGISVPGPV